MLKSYVFATFFAKMFINFEKCKFCKKKNVAYLFEKFSLILKNTNLERSGFESCLSASATKNCLQIRKASRVATIQTFKAPNTRKLDVVNR